MRVFVTGATGFIGSHVVKELLAAGHEVLGLARSDASAQALNAVGANVQRGSLEDIKSLKSGTTASDAVIHLGMSHDFSNFLKSWETDKQAIEAMGSVLAGSDRPLIVVTGLAGLTGPGQLATEESVVPPNFPFPRVSEQIALGQLPKGVCASVMRLPQVHDTRKQGLIISCCCRRRRADARYSRDHRPRFEGAGNFNISGRSSRLFWLVGYVRRSRPSGIKCHNEEKARVESDRASSDLRFGTDGLLPL